MKRMTVLFLFTSLLSYQNLIAQADVTTSTQRVFTIEPFVGFSGSFAQGDFIDYQKSFHTVTEAESTIKGSIQPILMATLGVQARYKLFKEGNLSPLQVSVGLQYHQKGFKNSFVSTYTAPTNYTDVTKYAETYKLNYLSVPIQARWGNKWFGTLGFSLDYYIAGSRNQKVSREQSGAGSIDSGFKSDLNQKKSLLKSEIKKSTTGLVLGGGIELNDGHSLALQANFSDKVFNTYPDNFKNITLQFLYLKAF
jgi:hypothetical protein